MGGCGIGSGRETSVSEQDAPVLGSACGIGSAPMDQADALLRPPTQPTRLTSLAQDRVDPEPVRLSTRSLKARLDHHQNRGPGFDTLRLLAASAVVLHHSLTIEYDIVFDDWLFAFSRGYTHLGLFSVAIFFCLSGFLVTPGLVRNGDVISYFSRRFMRIMPLLAFVVVVTALVIGPLVSSRSAAEYYTSSQTWIYLKNVTTSLSLALPGVVNYDGGDAINGPLWTLRFEWICYIIIAAASLAGVLRRRYLFLVLWVGAVAALPALHGWRGADDIGSASAITLLLFGYFGAGVLVFLFGDVLRWSPLFVVLATVALAVSFRTGLGLVLAPGLTAYLIAGLGLMRFPWTGFLERADLSYGVYLTHSVILMVLMHVFTFTNWWTLFAACLALSYLAALGTWTFIERPALRHKKLPERMARRVLDAIPLGLLVKRAAR